MNTASARAVTWSPGIDGDVDVDVSVQLVLQISCFVLYMNFVF